MSETETPAKLDIEVCRSTAPNVSVRADDFNGDEAPVMEGHFATFNEWYEINSVFEGHFMERIAPGAFKRTFNAARNSKDPHRISVILEHGFDPTVGDKPLGVPTVLEEDSTGPRYEVPLFDTSYNRDLLPALRAGAYGSSFRFKVLREEVAEPGSKSHSGNTDLPERTIKEVRVMEFGPTIFPANPSASAGLRSLTDEYYQKLRDRDPEAFSQAVERAARNRGLSDPNVLLSRFTQDDPVSEKTDHEDPHAEHSSDPSETGHSEDPQSTHSDESETRRSSARSSRPSASA